jgi:hypothetical protein
MQDDVACHNSEEFINKVKFSYLIASGVVVAVVESLSRFVRLYKSTTAVTYVY